MIVHASMVALDWNNNVGRLHRKERVVVPVLVEKNTNWQDIIMDACISSLETGDIPNPEVSSNLEGKKLNNYTLYMFYDDKIIVFR